MLGLGFLLYIEKFESFYKLELLLYFIELGRVIFIGGNF